MEPQSPTYSELVATVSDLTRAIQALESELAQVKQQAEARGSLLETVLRHFTHVAGTLHPTPNPADQVEEEDSTKHDAGGSSGRDSSLDSHNETKHGELPSGWEWRSDETQEHWYYYHPKSLRSQWEKPRDPSPYRPEGIANDDVRALQRYHCIDLWVGAATMVDILLSHEDKVEWQLIKASCYRRLGFKEWALHIYEQNILHQQPQQLEALRYSLALRRELQLDVGDLEEQIANAQKAVNGDAPRATAGDGDDAGSRKEATSEEEEEEEQVTNVDETGKQDASPPEDVDCKSAEKGDNGGDGGASEAGDVGSTQPPAPGPLRVAGTETEAAAGAGESILEGADALEAQGTSTDVT